MNLHPVFTKVLATRRDSFVRVVQNLNKTLEVTCRRLLGLSVWEVSPVEFKSDQHLKKPQLSIILPMTREGWTTSHWECLVQRFQEHSATRYPQTIVGWEDALRLYEDASLMEKVTLRDQRRKNLQVRLLMLVSLTVMVEQRCKQKDNLLAHTWRVREVVKVQELIECFQIHTHQMRSYETYKNTHQIAMQTLIVVA